jgi:hypothetical protein
MSTVSLQPFPFTKSFFEQVTKKHHPEARIVRKSDSWLMKVIGFILKPFNPNFMKTYTTTIGGTIYVPDQFSENDDLRCLNLLAHETQHIIDYVENPVLFTLGYLFPQCLACLSILGFFGFITPWMFLWFLALCFLAPIPAPWRYKSELAGYRVSLLMGKKVFGYNNSEMKQIRERIKQHMTTGNYYYAWPFPQRIDHDLDDDSFEEEPRYQEIVNFIQTNLRISLRGSSF